MEPKHLTATIIAHCGGMTPARRSAWVKHGLSQHPPFSEFDAIETAVARILSERTTQKRAPEAFRQIQQELRKAIVAGHVRLWAVVPAVGHGSALASSPAKALKLAEGIDEALWVAPLAKGIELAKTRYEQQISIEPNPSAGIVQRLLPGEKSKSS